MHAIYCFDVVFPVVSGKSDRQTDRDRQTDKQVEFFVIVNTETYNKKLKIKMTEMFLCQFHDSDYANYIWNECALPCVLKPTFCKPY